jgi:apolipoprotein N-acyltransferase
MSTSLGYEEQGALKGSVGLNSKLTFYSKHGDYIAGFSKYSFVILLILSLGRVFRKKS